MAYNPKISKQKAVEGSLDGAMATLVGAAVVAVVKSVVSMDQVTENSIAVAAAAVVSSAFVGFKAWLFNWRKHRDPKTVVPPKAEPPKP